LAASDRLGIHQSFNALAQARYEAIYEC
jgi:hypothetical protein